MASATRHVGTDNYTQSVVAYDALYRPKKTTLQLPTGDELVQKGAVASTGIVKSYLGYNLDGTPSYVVEPKIGGLPYERVGTYYNEVGNPSMVRGIHQYVTGAGWSATGELSWANLEVAKDSPTRVSLSNSYELGTRRLLKSRVKQVGELLNAAITSYAYNDAGQVTSIYDAPEAIIGAGTGGDLQCFSYDGLQRLTRAWTPDATGYTRPDPTSGVTGDPDPCRTTPSAAGMGGPAPYWKNYAYDSAGQRTATTVRDRDGGLVSSSYERPGAGTVPAHGITGVTTTDEAGVSSKASYGYDPTGNTVSRPAPGGGGQQLTWDIEGRLESTTDPVTGTTTSYLYDADGGLLVRRTNTTGPTGTSRESTLYAGSTEATVKTTTTTKTTTSLTGRRSYRLGGLQVGVRERIDPDTATTETDPTRWGKFWFTTGDHHGTMSVAIDPEAKEPLVQRYMDPSGCPAARSAVTTASGSTTRASSARSPRRRPV